MRHFLVALALAFATTASAQTSSPTSAAESSDFSTDRFRAHVAFLSDDLLEGRDTGSRGYDIAAAYVASQFMALGLQPGGEHGGWYQPVPFRAAALRGTPSLTVSGPAGTQSWSDRADVRFTPSAISESLDFEAPIVFVGYGVDAPDQGVDDYRGLDVRGRIVAVLAGMPTGLPSEIAAHLADQKPAMAARHGAIGLVTVYTDQYATLRPWEREMRAPDRPRLVWLTADGAPNDEAPGLRAEVTLNDAAAAALFAGARRTYAEIRREAARPGARPRGFPLRTRLRIRADSAWSALTSPEVIGLLPGSDPVLRDEYVVLMAHLDHLGMRADGGSDGNAPPARSPAGPPDRVYNGALDNAAGIATMLEAARAFIRSGERPRRSVLFIANTAEEKGLAGADYYAHFPTVPIGRIAAVVDLDMPVLLYDFTDVIAFGADHSTVARTVARAAARMNVALAPDPMPEENIFVRSDHYQFVRQGVPAILLMTGFASGGDRAWRDFLAGRYHQVDDDMAQPINWAAGARYSQLNYLISRELADADQRPLWYRGDYFGDLFSPGTPRAERDERSR